MLPLRRGLKYTSGYSGYSGAHGYSGYSGASGAHGASGYSGYTSTDSTNLYVYTGSQSQQTPTSSHRIRGCWPISGPGYPCGVTVLDVPCRTVCGALRGTDEAMRTVAGADLDIRTRAASMTFGRRARRARRETRTGPVPTLETGPVRMLSGSTAVDGVATHRAPAPRQPRRPLPARHAVAPAGDRSRGCRNVRTRHA